MNDILFKIYDLSYEGSLLYFDRKHHRFTVYLYRFSIGRNVFTFYYGVPSLITIFRTISIENLSQSFVGQFVNKMYLLGECQKSYYLQEIGIPSLKKFIIQI